jgi:release factor glutamine methyltransferase
VGEMQNQPFQLSFNASLDEREAVFARGFQDFMGITLRVVPGILIPREETELLGYTALECVASMPSPRIIDMCAGSGNISCALAANVPSAMFWAVDITPECIDLITQNVVNLSFQDRIVVQASNLFSTLLGRSLENTIDLVVANPPYISTSKLENERKDLLTLEPREAFEAGPFGFRVIQKIINDAHLFLREDRPLCLEFGAGQHGMVKRLFDRSGFYNSVRFVSDSEGTPRVAVALKK